MFWSWQVNAEQPVGYAILDCKLTSFGGATIDKHEYFPELDDDEMHNFQALIIQDPSKKQTQIKTVLFSSNIDLVSSEKIFLPDQGAMMVERFICCLSQRNMKIRNRSR